MKTYNTQANKLAKVLEYGILTKEEKDGVMVWAFYVNSQYDDDFAFKKITQESRDPFSLVDILFVLIMNEGI